MSKPKTKKQPKAKAKKKSSPRPAPAKKVLKKQAGTSFHEKKLLEMREDLVELVHSKQELDLTDQEVGDEADAATQSAERELLFELSDNERQQLDAIEAALRKIETGSFGQCEGCSKPIPAPRLKAMPQARYCVQCQARFEIPSR
jgi:DnaK suppressor protein